MKALTINEIVRGFQLLGLSDNCNCEKKIPPIESPFYNNKPVFIGTSNKTKLLSPHSSKKDFFYAKLEQNSRRS